MTQEIERLEVEVVEEIRPGWEELISEWSEGFRQELTGQLRQARAAASVGRHYGWASMTRFAQDVGASPRKAYDYAKVWAVYGHIFEDGGELCERLQTLTMTHLIKSLRAPNPIDAANEAHDEDLSTRQLEDRIAQREEVGAEVVEMVTCPVCHGEGKVPKE